MSAETLEYLRQNTLIGYAEKRGTAWHAARGVDADGGLPANHFDGPVPLERVESLFDFRILEADLQYSHIGDDGVLSGEVAGRKAIVRGDTGAVFGIFTKDGYKVHQPKAWLVDVVGDILDRSNDALAISGAGLLRGGARQYVQFEMEDMFESAEGVKHRPFLFAGGSLDGSLSTTYGTGTQVIVCDNTFMAALGESKGSGHQFKVKHSTNSMSRLGEVRDRLDIVVAEAADAFDQEVRALLEVKVTESQWRDFALAYAGDFRDMEQGRGRTMAENKFGTLNRMWQFDERVAPWKGTAWGVTQAVNTYVAHEQSVKGMTRAERNSDRILTGDWSKVSAGTSKLLDLVGIGR